MTKYYPILKWKRGEQQAVEKLEAPDREPMLPILEVMPKPGHTTIASVTPTLTKAAKENPVGLDLRYVHTSGVSIAVLAKLCGSLQQAGFQAHPVISAVDLFAQLNELSVLNGLPVVILRLRLQTLPMPATLSAISGVRKAIGKKARLHVVLDFGPIGEVEEASLTGFAAPFVHAVLTSGDANYVAIAGGSFPITLTGIPVGVNNLLRRREWHVWLAMRGLAGCQDVRFGDYTVTNPELLEIEDPKAMNPSAAIRYALDGEWWLLRGRGVKNQGYGQYNTLCRLLIADSRYYGATYSYGDEGYDRHAKAGAKSGNLTTWRRDAANHHLVQTIRRLDPMI